MKENREKFKQFVIEQLKDYDEWREASPDGYAEIITDEAVKLFCQPAVIKSVCNDYFPSFDEINKCLHCGFYKHEHRLQTVLHELGYMQCEINH